MEDFIRLFPRRLLLVIAVPPALGLAVLAVFVRWTGVMREIAFFLFAVGVSLVLLVTMGIALLSKQSATPDAPIDE